MKHKTKVPIVYTCLVMLVVTVVLYHSAWNDGIPHLVSVSHDNFRTPKIWKPYFFGSENGVMRMATDGFPTIAFEDKEVYQNEFENNKSTLVFRHFKAKANKKSYWDTDVPHRVSVFPMPKEFYREVEINDIHNSTLKKILIWNEGYGSKTMGFGFGRSPFQFAKCEVDACITTGNRKLLPFKDFDAVIFHFRATTLRDLPKVRYYHQRWIFEEVESSAYVYQDPAIYNGLFNWTMTFRRDSDIVNTYGRVFREDSPTNDSLIRKNYAEGKTKMAAWFVSNCYTKSSREKIVRKLQNHFKIDIFGRCGPFSCPHTSQCYHLLEKTYKFYFSFENSLCKDYVTEKLFDMLKYNVVPVVYGLAKYRLLAPPGSYINILDFPDLDNLAKYLKYLDSNDTAYNEYFRWKGHYKIENGWSNTAQSFCDLCKKLHQDETPQVYDDIKKWFMVQGHCKRLKTKGWF